MEILSRQCWKAMVGVVEVQTTIKPSSPFRTFEILSCEYLPEKEVSFGCICNVIPWLDVMVSQELKREDGLP